ncbi:MAG: hypothetical protein ACOYEV_15720, partial [Candidatus Nanopelagicales bacterium]
VFDTPTPTVDGFTVNVTNYDPAWTWTPVVVSPSGALVVAGAPSGTTLPLTITGLNPGQSATIRIDTTRTGYHPGSSETTGAAANGAARNPVLDTPTPTVDGFTVNVTNYDAAWDWEATVIDPAGATITPLAPTGNTWPIAVGGLKPGQSGKIRVTTTRMGYKPGTADITGTAVTGTARNPVFDTPVATAAGFTVNITNYDPAWTWTPAVVNTSGASVVAGTHSGATLPLTITGLDPGQSGKIRVTTTRTGYEPGTADISGTAATGTARNPIFDTPVPTADGFTVNITNYNSAWAWTPVAVNPAGTSVVAGTPSAGTLHLVISGLAASQSATIRVYTTRAGHLPGHAQVTGSALAAAGDPLAPQPDAAAQALTDDVWVSIDGTGYPATIILDRYLGQVIITGPEFQLTLSALGSDGRLILPLGGVWTLAPGQFLQVTGIGLAPNSQVQIHLFSTPITVGVGNTAADGTFNTTVTIPGDTIPGLHVLQANGWTAAGRVASTSVQAQIAPPITATAKATSAKSKLTVKALPYCTQYSFRVLRRITSVEHGSEEPITRVTYKWMPKTYKTSGKKPSKTVDLPKGTYRAHVLGGCGKAGTTTDWAKLTK